MIREPVRVQLDLESHPENVAVVRAMIVGFADAAELGAELAGDLRTAVSEACNNVVLHAYDGRTGPMLVQLVATPQMIDVTIADRGRGIRRISGGDEHMGLGLAVISSLADKAEFRTPKGGGTEVAMCFRHDGAVLPRDEHGPSEAEDDGAGKWPPLSDRAGPRDLNLWLTPTALTGYVLGPLVRAVAAVSQFSLSRVNDLHAINDAIAAYAELAADDGVAIALSVAARRVSVTSGPFVIPVPGAQDGSRVSPKRAQELAHRRRSLAELVDALSSEHVGDDHELLCVTLVDADRHGG